MTFRLRPIRCRQQAAPLSRRDTLNAHDHEVADDLLEAPTLAFEPERVYRTVPYEADFSGMDRDEKVDYISGLLGESSWRSRQIAVVKVKVDRTWTAIYVLFALVTLLAGGFVTLLVLVSR